MFLLMRNIHSYTVHCIVYILFLSSCSAPFKLASSPSSRICWPRTFCYCLESLGLRLPLKQVMNFHHLVSLYTHCLCTLLTSDTASFLWTFHASYIRNSYKLKKVIIFIYKFCSGSVISLV